MPLPCPGPSRSAGYSYGRPPAGLRAGVRGRAGQFGEGDEPADCIRRDVADRVSQPPAVPAQPASRYVNLEDHDPLDPAAVTLDGVQHGPAGRGRAVQPNDL